MHSMCSGRASSASAGRHVTLEVTGTEHKITALIGLMAEYGAAEVARTGRVALARGAQSLAGSSTEVR